MTGNIKTKQLCRWLGIPATGSLCDVARAGWDAAHKKKNRAANPYIGHLVADLARIWNAAYDRYVMTTVSRLGTDEAGT